MTDMPWFSKGLSKTDVIGNHLTNSTTFKQYNQNKNM